MPDKYEYLTAKDLEPYGIKLAAKRFFDSGETRAQLRLTLPGEVEVQTGLTTGSVSGWQKAHSHERAHELYIVQAGWILLVGEDGSGNLQPRFLGPNDHEVALAGGVHNVFVGPGAVFMTTRYGQTNKYDRIDAPEFDEQIRREMSDNPDRLLEKYGPAKAT